MRRVGYLLTILCLLVVSGCGKSFKDISVTDFEIVSVTPSSSDLSSAQALLKVGISNPIVGFELTGLNGLLKVDGKPCVCISTDQLIVFGKSDRTYMIPVSVTVPDGANIFDILNVLKTRNKPRFVVGVSGKVALRGGAGFVVQRDISLDSFIDAKSLISSVSGFNLKKLIINGINIVSVESEGVDRCRILFDVNLSNPYVKIEVSDIEALLKMDSVPGIDLRSAGTTVIEKGDNVYFLSLEGFLSEGFNPCSLLKLLQSSGAPSLTADFSLGMGIRGIGTRFSWSDITLYRP